MEYLLKKYKIKCKEEFGEYQFKPYKNNYYRIINDVFQSFNLHISTSGSSCTVEFGIIPLSVSYDLNKTSVSPYHLKNFENCNNWFDYDRNSLASIDMCIDSMISYMKKYLMPLFNKATDCKTAYAIMCEYDRIFENNSYERYCMCLKFGDYDNAKKHLDEVIRKIEIAFERNKKAFEDENIIEYIQKIEKKLSVHRALLKQIDDKDYQGIQMWLVANENKNKQNLGFRI